MKQSCYNRHGHRAVTYGMSAPATAASNGKRLATLEFVIDLSAVRAFVSSTLLHYFLNVERRCCGLLQCSTTTFKTRLLRVLGAGAAKYPLPIAFAESIHRNLSAISILLIVNTLLITICLSSF